MERCIDLIFLLNDYPISTMEEENVIVYRGQKDYSFYDGMVEGTTFVQPSFFSTTLNIDTARNFAGGSEILLRILVPNNVPLPFISERLTPLSNSTGGNESEILFPPSTEFRFIDFTIENGIKMEKLDRVVIIGAWVGERKKLLHYNVIKLLVKIRVKIRIKLRVTNILMKLRVKIRVKIRVC